MIPTTQQFAEHPRIAEIEGGLHGYLAELYLDLYDGEAVMETLSGQPYCGCDTCTVREIFYFLVPKIAELTLDIAGVET